ncbi:MAG: hypothetical protein R3F60_00950 [bacterium]
MASRRVRGLAVIGLLGLALAGCDDGGGSNGAGGGGGGGGGGDAGPQAQLCITFDNCQANEVCRANTCVQRGPGDCRTSEDCVGAQICDDASARCQEPQVCGADEDCLEGRYCYRGLCSDPCAGDADCGGDACLQGRCEDAQPGCMTDAQCGAGRVCRAGMCEDAMGCEDDAACPGDQVCVDGGCHEATPCLSRYRLLRGTHLCRRCLPRALRAGGLPGQHGVRRRWPLRRHRLHDRRLLSRWLVLPGSRLRAGGWRALRDRR